MTSVVAPTPPPRQGLGRFLSRNAYARVFIAIFLLFLVISWLMLGAEGRANLRFRIDFSPLPGLPLVLKAHIVGAVLAFVIGCVLLTGVKGNGLHRVLGYVWIAAMAVTAISSFWLTGLNGGALSWIHLLSGWTVIVLPMGLAAARRRNITAHRRAMTALFFGGMAIAGLFTFLPGRLMWQIFFTA